MASVGAVAGSFTLARHPYELVDRSVQLAERTEIAPGFLRLRLTERVGDALVGFRAPGPGDHCRVIVQGLDPDGRVPVDAEGRALVASSTYTIVDEQLEHAPRWIDIDVVLHDDADHSPTAFRAGVARWAATAPLGAPAVITGPKGSVIMTGRPERVLLAGDDTAVPALRRYLGMLGPDTLGDLLLETHHDPAALGLEVPTGIELSILSPVPHDPSAPIVAALTDRPPPPAAAPADVFVFVCAEQSVVAPARAMLARWGIAVESAVVKGYWKR